MKLIDNDDVICKIEKSADNILIDEISVKIKFDNECMG